MSRKALAYPGQYLDVVNHRAIDTIRTLAQAQDEVSSNDVVNMISWPKSSPELLECILWLELVQDNLVHADGGENLSALGAALRNYGFHITRDSDDSIILGQAFPAKWELIIRKLLHIGLDIHALVPRRDFFRSFQSKSYHSTLSRYGTPLDELFTFTKTAGQAQDAADAWLQILSTVGVDVSSYLEKEVALHNTQPMFTRPWDFDYNLPRQLVFSLGEAPTVYADWWIDPECSTYLVRQEFKDITILTDNDSCLWEGWRKYERSTWKSVWPISYPSWSDFLKPIYNREDLATWERFNERAQERANCRWQKKAMRAARRNGTQFHSSMPGAWPE